jgi:COMPASS component SDC1
VITIPKEAPPHGAPTRQYLNGKVTGPVLEGMKIIAKEQYVSYMVMTGK